jgi:hypothetical protein
MYDFVLDSRKTRSLLRRLDVAEDVVRVPRKDREGACLERTLQNFASKHEARLAEGLNQVNST